MSTVTGTIQEVRVRRSQALPFAIVEVLPDGSDEPTTLFVNSVLLAEIDRSRLVEGAAITAQIGRSNSASCEVISIEIGVPMTDTATLSKQVAAPRIEWKRKHEDRFLALIDGRVRGHAAKSGSGLWAWAVYERGSLWSAEYGEVETPMAAEKEVIDRLIGGGE